ncbi:MAG: amylo-alpha-1,6-glucosidase [Tenuifilaceae bacterium]|jgi:cellobiose phosphorylase|nr:amylo-alpha-1,6-glucosidase [Tenuifilaceae bacterium]
MIIKNSHGLNIHFLENGSVKSIEVHPIRVSLKKNTPFSKSGANIFLRKRNTPFEYTALIGPESNSVFSFEDNKFVAKGSWNGIGYLCVLQLSTKSLSWQWSVEIKNKSNIEVELDLIYVQDVGLKTISNGLVNEYYVSQYIERLVLNDKSYGSVICCRQNMKESGVHPWLMMACKNGALSASTDGMQFYGKTFRITGIPEGLKNDTLGGEYAGESAIVALQEEPFKLELNKTHRTDFVATFLPNHPLATSTDDLKMLPSVVSEFSNTIPAFATPKWISPSKNLFNTAPFLSADDLTDEELTKFFGEEKRHIEQANGKVLSFFSLDSNHVVLRAKEILVDRPHGHIMQAEARFVPDESIVSTNTFAYGVFNSHITQGNTNFNILLSVCSSQFNTALETGQRIFVKIDGKHYLLSVPSAYEIGLNYTRWIYKFGNQIFQIRTWTSKSAPQVNLDFKVITGNDVDILITHDFDFSNGWNITSGKSNGEYIAKSKAESLIAGKFPNALFRIAVQSIQADYRACRDEILYNDESQSGSLFILEVKKTSSFCMSFLGEVCSPAKLMMIDNPDEQWLNDCNQAKSEWQKLSLNLSLQGDQKDITAISEILPWFGMNALTHYLTPYGLEQFGGAAWGTRDVSQGPIDLLLNLEKYEEAKQVLRIIFSNQNTDGGWPQWWMFDSYTNIRAHEAHGDIIYWCIIALSNYIKVTGDIKILDEVLPYYSEDFSSKTEKTPLSEHVDRLIKMIVDSFIPGTSLVPFGGGDWNDSLQPVSEELAQRMISSWTVEMNYQAFTQYQKVYELGGNQKKANELKDICKKIKADFNNHLVKDGIVAGYGLVEEDNSISVLLHPSDKTTGIHYSILPMNRGIICGIFTNEQAKIHQDLIEQHLKGPDGARLMDKPLKYQGGIQKIFQRAESSTFFGREIGLMYVHEHIRYAESLAIMGKAEAFIKALRQAIPIDYQNIVLCGDIRQSNCYYSSSDIIFKSRYDADLRYNEAKLGKLTVRGGWRVYSSGPGIYIGLVISRLLGLRIDYGNIIIDPVMPRSFNEFSAQLNFLGKSVEIIYKVKNRGYSPNSIHVNGEPIHFTLEQNPYREGGVQIPMPLLLRYLSKVKNEIIIHL